MVKDAQSHAAEDKEKRELVDLRNQADNLAYSVEKLLNENKGKVAESDAKPIEEAIAETRKAVQGEDAAAIKTAMDALTRHSHKLAEELYKQAGPATAGPGAGSPGGQPDGAAPGGQAAHGDVVDAEYTVKD